MCFTKRFLDWLEGKFHDLDFEHDSDEKCIMTSIGVGMVEGIIDGCVYIGMIEFISAIVKSFCKFIKWILKKN